MMLGSKSADFRLVDSGLIHRMKITPSGGTFTDDGSAGGTWTITATREAGPFSQAGNGAIMTASSGILTRSSPTSLAGAATAHTISWWAKAEAAATVGYICTGSQSTNLYSGHEISAVSSGYIGISVGTGGSGTSGNRRSQAFTAGDQRDGEWHHYCILFTGEVVDGVYVDDSEASPVGAASGTGSSIGYSGTSDWRLNCTGWTDQTGIAYGSIADVRIYNRQLTAAEITRIANKGG